MAAEALGKPSFTIHDLVDDCMAGRADRIFGLVESAGGVRSPLAVDGDCLRCARGFDPDLIVLVADAGLGTINAVRLTSGALRVCAAPVLVVLNRFDGGVDVHVRNREWLVAETDGRRGPVLPGDERRKLADRGAGPRLSIF